MITTTSSSMNAVAIVNGAGQTNQHPNTIVLNASGIALNTAGQGRFYAQPIRQLAMPGNNVLWYDAGNQEILYDSAKTFVIHHPTMLNKYLVHACLEGPEAGVYYRGVGMFEEGKVISTVELPEYVVAFATDFTVQATAIMSEVHKVPVLGVSEVDEKEGKFKVFRDEIFHNALKYNWVVYAKRGNIEVEPDKDSVTVHGNGPYKWI